MEKEIDRSRFPQDLIKSRQRMADHGEVFTPRWLVEAMLDLTIESDRIEARVLESACGDGNFLVRVLQRKLAVVELKSRKSSQDKKRLALLAIMSLYGIELLRDNIVECRKRLLSIFADYLKLKPLDEYYRAATRVLSLNLIHGDALKMRTNDGRPIVFAEWEYSGKGEFRRRDFRFDLLAQASAEEREALALVKTYPPMDVGEIALSPASRVREITL